MDLSAQRSGAFNDVNSSRVIGLSKGWGAAAIIWAGGWSASWLEPESSPTIKAGALIEADGSSGKRVVLQRTVVALVGGFRPLLADLSWVRAYDYWSRKDLDSMRVELDRVVSLDARPLTFWLNGARMLAYDATAWRLEVARAAGVTDPNLEIMLKRDQANEALAWLARAGIEHPDRSAIDIERGMVLWRLLENTAGAADAFRLASGKSDAPYFAARVHAEFLRRQGKLHAALAWLIDLYPNLPRREGPGVTSRMVEDARAGVVLERIRRLEAELDVSPAERFVPPNTEGDVTLQGDDGGL